MAIRGTGAPIRLAFALWVALAGGMAHAQEHARFDAQHFTEQVLAYTPVQRDGVSDADFAQGEFFLTQTKLAVGNDPANFSAPHYWNVAVAFLYLGEPNGHIGIAFEAAVASDLAAICLYLDHRSGDSFDEVIPEVILPIRASCLALPPSDDEFDVERYIASHEFDADLVREIAEILADDQRDRSSLGEQQAALDRANQARIDQLFQAHGTYIGQSLVGEDLEDVMFLVIQHSHLEYMERYLPYVQAAVLSGEIGGVTPLKMLLDRIYMIREGHQIFGSQAGVPIADEATRRAVIESYQIP